ncbi:hypothetical protein DRQ33_07635 [bacterium]|nr:MAG: hypothetical protein DRQ33_07635 [bacterium]
MNEDVNYTIFDAIQHIGRRLWLIVILPIIAGILAVCIGYLLPKWYRAEAQVLPPYSSRGIASSMLSGIVGGVMGLGGEGNFELPFMVSPTDLWAAVAKSTGIADSVIAKYDLKQRYGARNMYFARKYYLEHLYVDISQEGILTIGYEDYNPDTSAMITSTIVQLLDKTLRKVHTTSAHRTRQFLEDRIAQCEKELEKAEQKLIDFQREHNAISLEDQAKVAVENVAQLYAQLSYLEVQINSLIRSGVQYSPELSQFRAQANELRRKIKELEAKGDTLILGIPLNRYPDLIADYARLYRDMKVQEIVYELLKQQYEQAKIEEQRSTSTLHIVSSATPPEKKYRPKKAIMGIATTMGAFIIIFLWVLLEGYLINLRRYAPSQYEKITSLWRMGKK